MSIEISEKTIKKIKDAGVKDVPKFINKAIKEKLKTVSKKTKKEEKPQESFDDKLKKFIG